MKIAFLVTDNRDPFREYEKTAPWFDTAPEALLQGFVQTPEVEVHVVSCTRKPMKSPAMLAENMYFHSLRVPKTGWRRTAYWGCIRAVRRRLREIQPDIVHGLGTERGCALGAVCSGFPNVLTIHSNMRLAAKFHKARPFSFYWLAARLEAYAVPRAHGIVCPTTYTQRAVSHVAKNTWVVPSAVDSSFFEIVNQPLPLPRILCVGTIGKRKNQNALIRALDALTPTGRFEVYFLGRANHSEAYGKEFLELVEERPWCRYKGFVDREAITNYLTGASGLIMPSLEDNCPMAILEAMAAGVPVAAAHIGGIPDLIEQGETGILFDPRDTQAMAGAVGPLLDDVSRTLAHRAHEEAAIRFHPETIAQQHLDIYREVLHADRRSDSRQDE